MKMELGLKGWFTPYDGTLETRQRAEVIHVWSDTCANIRLADGTERTSVLLKLTGAIGNVFEPDEEPMETMVQPKITGYRQLTKGEVDLMNEGKALAEACGAYIAKLRQHGDSARPLATKDSAEVPSPLLLDQRWISIGSTDLQRGFMAVIRGIAQPTTF